ncbi:MAG: IS110 family transposase [Solirubrobacterales bacterium]
MTTTWVGLDVHASSIDAAATIGATGEMLQTRLPGEAEAVMSWVQDLPGEKLRVTYEAGPTGFGLARSLASAGIDVLVCAPGLVPRAPRGRIKTDRRDAELLMRCLMSGQPARVHVPTVEEEGLRELVRAREDLRRDLMSARHRISKMLLRYGVRHPMLNNRWGREHLVWLGKVELPDPSAQVALRDQLGVHEFLIARRHELEEELFARIESSSWAETAAKLRCLRGIGRLSAAGLVAEIGDFTRFPSAPKLMAWLGLVPSEHSSGTKRVQGPITKVGSRHARRLLVEAAWNYRYPPRRNSELRARQKDQPAEVIARSWRTQQRLFKVWKTHEARGKRRTVTAVAVARELAGACWAVATM